MENPTVAIADQNTVVAVTETVVGHFVGEMGRKFRAQCTHVHHNVLVTRIDAREQRTGTAFLVLGETVGCRLAVMGVVEDIIGIEAVTLTFQTRENLVTVPLSQPIEVKRTLVMLAVIGLDKDARRGERELQAAVADKLARQQVTGVNHVGETQAHATNLETEQRRDITVHLHIGFPLAQMP